KGRVGPNGKQFAKMFIVFVTSLAPYLVGVLLFHSSDYRNLLNYLGLIPLIVFCGLMLIGAIGFSKDLEHESHSLNTQTKSSSSIP
ncbi:MAG: hypothetical protein ACXABN_18260, partial [Candidatus Thorarchaeota archaeon]